MSNVENKNSRYHHGNLRTVLVEASVNMVRQHGIEGLSLRKLAETVGVSRTAPYHHFKDKDALLAAVAEQGFSELRDLLEQVVSNPETALIDRLEQVIMDYLDFAVAHPTQYDLMFGQVFWRTQDQPEFQRHAKDCFRQYVKLFELFKDQGILKDQEVPLRLAQLMWATLHGLAKLASDGIFGKQNDINEITRYALKRFESSLNL